MEERLQETATIDEMQFGVLLVARRILRQPQENQLELARNRTKRQSCRYG